MYTHEWYLIFTKFWCCVMFSNPSSCYNITYLCITVMIKIHGQISIPLFIHFQFNDCFSNKSKDLNSKYNEKVFLYITLHLFLFLSWTSKLTCRLFWWYTVLILSLSLWETSLLLHIMLFLRHFPNIFHMLLWIHSFSPVHQSLHVFFWLKPSLSFSIAVLTL